MSQVSWLINVINDSSKHTIRFKYAEGSDWQNPPTRDSYDISPGANDPNANNIMTFMTNTSDNYSSALWDTLHFEIPGYPSNSYWALWIYTGPWTELPPFDGPMKSFYADYAIGWAGNNNGTNHNSKPGFQAFSDKVEVNLDWSPDSDVNKSSHARLNIRFTGDDFGAWSG